MKYIKLNTGAEMPMLGFGVYGVGEGDEGKAVIRAALEAGYRGIDTAAAYGNENLVGQAIRESGIKRGEVFVTTKLSNPAQREGNIEGEFAQSLKNLGMDYVDLYLIHWPVAGHFVDSWLAMEKICESGRARAIGISNFQAHHIADIKKAWGVVPAMNQIELHPFLTQKPLIDACRAEGIAPESWSPLGGGGAKEIKDNLLNNGAIEAIGKKYNKSIAQVILRWNIDLGIVTIPKSATPSRIKANIDIFDFCLTPDEIAAIDGLNKNQRTGPDPDDFNF